MLLLLLPQSAAANETREKYDERRREIWVEVEVEISVRGGGS